MMVQCKMCAEIFDRCDYNTEYSYDKSVLSHAEKHEMVKLRAKYFGRVED